MSGFGVTEPCGRLRRVLVRRPDEAFAAAEPEMWNYSARPVLGAAQAEHDAFVATLEEAGVEVLRHEGDLPGLADSIFVCDPAFMTSRGAILLRMGKSLRCGEEEALGSALQTLGVPIFARLEGEGTVEGGDLLRLDASTVALGLGFRTDTAGHRELAEILSALDVEVIPFDLPCLDGEHACLHLRSLVSLPAPDLALVYRPLLPVRLWQLLSERCQIVEVPDEEFSGLAPNVLALAPRRCLMLEGNPRTQRRLQRAGCRVATYRGDELSRKAEGGATCLTLPLARDAAS